MDGKLIVLVTDFTLSTMNVAPPLGGIRGAMINLCGGSNLPPMMTHCKLCRRTRNYQGRVHTTEVTQRRLKDVCSSGNARVQSVEVVPQHGQILESREKAKSRSHLTVPDHMHGGKVPQDLSKAKAMMQEPRKNITYRPLTHSVSQCLMANSCRRASSPLAMALPIVAMSMRRVQLQRVFRHRTHWRLAQQRTPAGFRKQVLMQIKMEPIMAWWTWSCNTSCN